MIKAVFFDIDGTLLSHASGGVPDSAADALRRLRERGILVLAATGRHKRDLEQLPVGHLQFDGYVASDGQICLDAGGALLYRLPIGRAAAEKLVDSFARREAPVLLVELEDMYINFVDQSVREAQRAISTPLPKIRDYRGGEIYQAIVFRDREYVARMAARLPGCRISGWHPYAFDIVPEEGVKPGAFRRCWSITASGGRSAWPLETGRTTSTCCAMPGPALPWETRRRR